MRQIQDIKFNGKVVFWQHVKDVQRAKAWYIEVLGMEFEDQISEDLLVLRITPGVDTKKVALKKSSKENPKTHAMLDFRVENIETAHRTLLAKGVEVSEIREVSDYRRDIQLCDPDGHVILLHEAVVQRRLQPLHGE
ncbi:VOC family protein [Paenibacillus allorhizosphaerae]|uniref:VOC domain-containing protein n=1 Tax=Paenibacillus allorhizosphaerae TaxID=2849866 RepID=A0ABN7U0Z9_9BACL|nr:VOC family protein [Paenibacillus allorhizosphaerae]CAG7658267.1 hypothetical protein PAECIP111802_07000 [Paenibacillus allorhizosphaerae]